MIVRQEFFDIGVGARPAALPKGIPLPFHFLWRIKPVRDAGQCGRFAECKSADRVGALYSLLAWRNTPKAGNRFHAAGI
jgi:hypothetical protein